MRVCQATFSDCASRPSAALTFSRGVPAPIGHLDSTMKMLPEPVTSWAAPHNEIRIACPLFA